MYVICVSVYVYTHIYLYILQLYYGQFQTDTKVARIMIFCDLIAPSLDNRQLVVNLI